MDDDEWYEESLSFGFTWEFGDSTKQLDRLEMLRRVVEEVTRKPVPRPERIKMGFY